MLCHLGACLAACRWLDLPPWLHRRLTRTDPTTLSIDVDGLSRDLDLADAELVGEADVAAAAGGGKPRLVQVPTEVRSMPRGSSNKNRTLAHHRQSRRVLTTLHAQRPTPQAPNHPHPPAIFAPRRHQVVQLTESPPESPPWRDGRCSFGSGRPTAMSGCSIGGVWSNLSRSACRDSGTHAHRLSPAPISTVRCLALPAPRVAMRSHSTVRSSLQ